MRLLGPVIRFAMRRADRSQLDAWLALAGTEPPQIYGYRMEEVVAKVGASR